MQILASKVLKMVIKTEILVMSVIGLNNIYICIKKSHCDYFDTCLGCDMSNDFSGSDN